MSAFSFEGKTPAEQNRALTELSKSDLSKLVQEAHGQLEYLKEVFAKVPIDQQPKLSTFPEAVDVFSQALALADDVLSQEAEPSHNSKVTIGALSHNIASLHKKLTGK